MGRISCFHTTMVLTQPGTPKGSILSEKFPYHYGSYATHKYAADYTGPFTFPYHYGSYATAYITRILYRFWGSRINQSGRSRKQHRICISTIGLDLILDGRSAMWREKAPVSSKEDRSQKVPAKHSPAEAYRRKMLSISLLIKWPILSRICVNCTGMILNRSRSVIRKWVQRKMVYDRSDEDW